MESPYKILGINEGSTKEDIKIAYKKLVKKYHPDQYANNPLSDLAEEKLKEINKAYNDLIGDSNNKNYNNTSSQYGYDSGENKFHEVRRLINSNNLQMAHELLNSMTTHNAEWNYLMGMLHLRKGWYDRGYYYINIAVNMDPSNSEYRSTLNNIHVRNSGYRDVGNGRGYNNSPSACQICECLICTDCCCECLGGDLISCC